MDELTIGDKIYISSKRAAAITGYAKDYVGQLCREGHVEAKMVGRSWYMLESSIRQHRFGVDESRQEELRKDTEGENAKESDPVIASGDDAKSDIDSAESAGSTGSSLHTWTELRYTSETVSELPKLAERPAYGHDSRNGYKIPESLPMSSIRPTFDEMQTAWKEWFEGKKEELGVLEEPEEEIAVVQREELRIQEAAEKVPEPVEPATPILVHRMPAMQPVQAGVRHDIYVRTPEKSEGMPKPAAVEVPTMVPQARPRKPKNRSGKGANIVVASLLFVLAGMSIAVAVVGSGFGGDYSNGNLILEYLGGARTISK